jgi:hypothetical protein
LEDYSQRTPNHMTQKHDHESHQIYTNNDEARRINHSDENATKVEGSVTNHMSLKIFILVNRINELISYLTRYPTHDRPEPQTMVPN